MTDLIISNLKSCVQALAGRHLAALSATLRGGEICGLAGPSGSGKSLLLRAISDLDQSEGEVALGDSLRRTMPANLWRRKVAYLPTDSAWWHETVEEHFLGMDKVLLQKLGFDEDVMGWKVSRISSGEKQRLALARSLNHSPEALLLDEPTASLDDSRTRDVEKLVGEYISETQAPVLWVSHDDEQLQRIAQHMITIQLDGDIQESGR